MTKEEYISELKINILSLTEDEQKETLQYYSDYFDEAKDVDKVVNELGTPAELAKIIIEKFANVPVETGKEEKNREEDETAKTIKNSEALFYKFDSSQIKNLNCNFGAAEVVAIPGSETKFCVETRGIQTDNFTCNLSADGNLTICNNKKINLSFFSHDRNNRMVPRILITVPEKMTLNKIRLAIGAGSFDTKNINIICNSEAIEVGAGNLHLGKINGGKMNVRCGMGRIDIEGKLKEKVNIDCGMGSVKFNLEGDPEKYSYDAKVGLGDFKFNDIRKNGVGNLNSPDKKENHFSVNCGMGTVNIQIK